MHETSNFTRFFLRSQIRDPVPGGGSSSDYDQKFHSWPAILSRFCKLRRIINHLSARLDSIEIGHAKISHLCRPSTRFFSCPETILRNVPRSELSIACFTILATISIIIRVGMQTANPKIEKKLHQ